MQGDGTISRRAFLIAGSGLAAGAVLWRPRNLEALPRLRVTGFELLPVRATERTVWLIVRLRTDAGLTVLKPPERFEHGAIRVPERPGLGIELNEKVVRAHLM